MFSSLEEEIADRWSGVRTEYGYPHIAEMIKEAGPTPLPLWKALRLEHYHQSESKFIDFYCPVSATSSAGVAFEGLTRSRSGYDCVIYIPAGAIKGFEAGPVAKEIDCPWAFRVYDAADEWLVMGKLEIEMKFGE